MMVVLVVFVAFGLVLGLRCVYVQGLDLAGHADAALMPATQEIPATRGSITDRNGQVLAQSTPAVNITVDPTIVATNGLSIESMSLGEELKAQAGPGIIAAILTSELGGDFQSYYNKLKTTKTGSGEDIRYAMLAQTVLTFTNLQIAARVEALGYVGLFREQAPIRNYPNGSVGSNVVGFMTHDDQAAADGKYPWIGGAGTEYSLNTALSGVDGQELYEWSPYGKIPTDTAVVKEPQEGYSYRLTLDMGLQYMQDKRLADAVRQTGSTSGKAITLAVKTGEILAMSNYPTYDPNDLNSSSPDDRGNRAIDAAYEPGSVQKVLTIAALVDQGIVTPATKVIVPSSVVSGGVPIKDSWSHDTIQLTAAGVIANSSNVGSVLLARQMSKQTMVDYLRSFGLGSPTDVGLPGEASGYLPDETMTDQTRDNMAFGQGLAVTAIQEAAAVAGIVNGGKYVSPRIVKSATDSHGNAVPVPESVTRQVVSPETSKQVVEMMEGVVALNSPALDIEGYRTAAKSGTAEETNPSCVGYCAWAYSYVGVAPSEDPEILTYVVLDHLTATGSGTSEAAPVVKDIMSVALPMFAVPVSTTPASDLPLTW
jgi:cell division protein FtsI (penicillin-binding protein 3)